ncbi:Protein-tyrosine-phosphatase [Caenorhabditis elegans]|uniref:Protein-tyrosine-phosphatase n=1 Tax=Caenorhabditis elegans TaxID=6239 RepID=U4PMU1_CAEEL|nr:Protein-tyrosine-phosphatase [Caenorhabditis elegans]CDH93414.1 Protein-tyrosine-phosphatase [Caenorhabditis elegans]|eukprot:NP_001294610.1 Uncharacterized protein CELE_Y69A2AR.19 [Caenorhabditis elegans]
MQHKMRFGQLLLLALFGVANGYREQFNTISSSVRQEKINDNHLDSPRSDGHELMENPLDPIASHDFSDFLDPHELQIAGRVARQDTHRSSAGHELVDSPLEPRDSHDFLDLSTPQELQDVGRVARQEQTYDVDTPSSVESLDIPSDTSNNAGRVARQVAPSKSADYLNHTTLIAHIANGIALQAGLMKGSIPIDAAVSELLNFGSVKVSDITAFKPDQITALIGKLKGVPASLVSTDPIVTLETRALDWNKLLIASKSIGDVASLPGKDDFSTELAKFENTFNFDSLSKTADTINSTIKSCSNLLDKSDTSWESHSAIRFKDLPGTLETLGSKVKEIINMDVSFDKLMNGFTAFQPLERLMHLVELRRSYIIVPVSNTPDITSNLKKVVEQVALAKAAGKSSMTVSALADVGGSKPKREHSVGFQSGISELKQLVKDVLDPWFSSLLNVTSAQQNNLADGLQSLFKTTDQLSRMNDKLKPIVSSSVQQTIAVFQVLVNEISLLSSDSAEMSSVMAELDKCSRTLPMDDQRVVGVELMKHINSLKLSLSQFAEFKTSTILNSLEKEITSFQNSYKFSDLQDPTATATEVKAVVESIQKSGSLEKFKQYLLLLQKTFADVDGNNLKTVILGGIKARITKIGDSTFGDFIKEELKVHTCLKAQEEQSRKLSQAIQATQSLRKLDEKMLEEVGSAASAVSSFAKDLATIKSIPETMKKEAKGVSTDLNGMADAKKNSDSVGQSVSSLQDASELIELESAIKELKGFGPEIDGYIKAVKSPEDRKAIETQWGNHHSDMASLESGLKAAKGFVDKIDVSKAKTMSDYGTPLANLKDLPDVKINALEKIKALDALIKALPPPKRKRATSDPKTVMEAAKSTLEKIAALDLQFSNHKTQYQQAPAAFKAFHDFLAKFLVTTHSNSTGGSDSGISITLIIIIVGSILALIGVAVGIYFGVRWYEKKKAAEQMEHEIVVWVKAQAYKSLEAAIIVLVASLHVVWGTQTSVSVEKSNAYLPKEKNRRPLATPCNPETAVEVMSDGTRIPIHANWINTSPDVDGNTQKFIATQGPLPNTSDDFWTMVQFHKVETVVMLCQFVEKEEEKCHEYFPVRTGQIVDLERYKLKTVTQEQILGDSTSKRTIQVEDTSKEFPTRTITHYQYHSWPDQGIPQGHAQCFDLMNMAKESKKPIVVHCSAGIGRTVSFIATQYIPSAVLANRTLVLNQAVAELRDQRWCAIQTVEQMYWVQVGSVYRLSKEKNIDMKHYKEQFEMLDGGHKFLYLAQEQFKDGRKDVLKKLEADGEVRKAKQDEKKATTGIDEDLGGDRKKGGAECIAVDMEY